jgi:hypothetical protein
MSQGLGDKWSHPCRERANIALNLEAIRKMDVIDGIVRVSWILQKGVSPQRQFSPLHGVFGMQSNKR